MNNFIVEKIKGNNVERLGERETLREAAEFAKGLSIPRSEGLVCIVERVGKNSVKNYGIFN